MITTVKEELPGRPGSHWSNTSQQQKVNNTIVYSEISRDIKFADFADHKILILKEEAVA